MLSHLSQLVEFDTISYIFWLHLVTYELLNISLRFFPDNTLLHVIIIFHIYPSSFVDYQLYLCI